MDNMESNKNLSQILNYEKGTFINNAARFKKSKIYNIKNKHF